MTWLQEISRIAFRIYPIQFICPKILGTRSNRRGFFFFVNCADDCSQRREKIRSSHPSLAVGAFLLIIPMQCGRTQHFPEYIMPWKAMVGLGTHYPEKETPSSSLKVRNACCSVPKNKRKHKDIHTVRSCVKRPQIFHSCQRSIVNAGIFLPSKSKPDISTR